MLARLMAGGRVSLLIALAGVSLSGVIGVTLGVAAGYYEGIIDTLIMRVADIQLAFPTILLGISVISGLGRPGVRSLLIVLVISGWVVYARLVRSRVVVVKHTGYVEAAQAAGASDLRILVQHILPNVGGIIIVTSTFSAGNMLILEAALSFLGLGVQPPSPTWGGMLNEGLQYLTTAWWISAFSGITLMAAILGINLIGDWLRDWLDPRLRF
jgi:peptide/nickel transport system permease protein